MSARNAIKMKTSVETESGKEGGMQGICRAWLEKWVIVSIHISRTGEQGARPLHLGVSACLEASRTLTPGRGLTGEHVLWSVEVTKHCLAGSLQLGLAPSGSICW